MHITLEEARDMLNSRISEPGLRAHALASAAVMRALSRRLGREEALWTVTGLLHDLDYEATADEPERHGRETAALLENALPPEALHAIQAHNSEHTGVEPDAEFDFALRCAESVTGLISAAALVRPEKMQGMQAKSLRKKMKQKAFAASVRRENILECERIGLDVNDFLTLAIQAMTECAGELGLE